MLGAAHPVYTTACCAGLIVHCDARSDAVAHVCAVSAEQSSYHNSLQVQREGEGHTANCCSSLAARSAVRSRLACHSSSSSTVDSPAALSFLLHSSTPLSVVYSLAFALFKLSSHCSANSAVSLSRSVSLSHSNSLTPFCYLWCSALEPLLLSTCRKNT